MTRIFSLTGWTQPDHFLDGIIPDVTPIPYSHLANFDEATTEIARQASGADMLIGWSLGGLLAMHSLPKMPKAPAKLLLISAPYCFVARNEGDLGMVVEQFAAFCHGFEQQPELTMQKFEQLIGYGDSQPDAVVSGLGTKIEEHSAYWLGCLENYDCTQLNTRKFPETVIIHGVQDAVTDKKQAEALHQAINGSTLHLIDNCGHAPHLHDAQMLAELIGL